MGVYEQDRYPFLSQEIQLLKKAACSGVPILGVCLGSQILAAASGAKVYPGHGKEIGWHPVRMTASAQNDEIFGGCPQEFMTFHWHGDTFDLPPGAELIASSSAYKNQAFRVGSKTWGIQFHPEITEPMVRDWVEHGIKKGEIDLEDSRLILESIDINMEKLGVLGKGLFQRFCDVIKG